MSVTQPDCDSLPLQIGVPLRCTTSGRGRGSGPLRPTVQLILLMHGQRTWAAGLQPAIHVVGAHELISVDQDAAVCRGAEEGLERYGINLGVS